MAEKIDPIKLAESLRAKMTPELQKELAGGDVKKSDQEAPAQPEAAPAAAKTEAAAEATQAAVEPSGELAATKPVVAPEEIKGAAVDITEPEAAQAGIKEYRKEVEAGKKEEAEYKEKIKEAEPIAEEAALLMKETKEGRDLEKELEKELETCRRDYADALLSREKAEKAVEKLRGWRRYFQGDKELRDRPAAEEDLKNVQKNFEDKQTHLKEGLKNYRAGLVGKKRTELAGAGKSQEEIGKEIEKYAKEVAILTSVKEATNIYLLKHEKEIEEKARLGEGQKWEWIQTKGLEAAQWYRKLDWKYKIGVAAGLAGTGVAIGVAGGASGAAIITGLALGRATQRALGGAATALGLEAWMKRSQEKAAEKKITKEFGENFSKSLQEKSNVLDERLFDILGGKKSEERRRYILAATMGGLIGTGAVAQAFNNLIPAEWKSAIAEKFGFRAAVEKPVGVKPLPPLETLKIGVRGPEGAIIDHLRANPDIAKTLGWDGKISFDQFAGTKAHQLWLEYANQELAKPETLAQLEKLGYSADLEGYAEMMRRIGKGFVEFDPRGGIRLTDTTFLKAAAPKAEILELVPEEEHILQPEALVGQEEPTPPTLDEVPPGSQDFYDEQLRLETTEIPPEERLENIKESLDSVSGKIDEIKSVLESADASSLEPGGISPQAEDILQGELKNYSDYKELLEKAMETKSYEEPLLVKDVLPPKIMELGHFKTVILAEKFSDLMPEERNLIDKLFYKYLGHSLENFRGLPPPLKDAYLIRLAQDAGEVVKSEAAMPEVSLPYKAFLWRNIGEMKWVQQIWEKFGGK